MIDIKCLYDLSNESYLRVKSEAELYAAPSSTDEMAKALRFARKNNHPVHVLGNGSNVLFAPFVPGLTLSTKNLCAVTFRENTLTSGSGNNNAFLVNECEKLGLSGLEYSVGFPGSTGGLIAMNAAYNADTLSKELEEKGLHDVNLTTHGIVKSVRAINPDGEIVNIENKDLGFSYRESIFQKEKNGWIVCDATFELQPRSIEEVKSIRNVMQKTRRSKEKHGKSLGCVFCPRDSSYIYKGETRTASWLLGQIEGVSGWREGGMYIDDIFPNHILHDKNGTAEGFLRLAERMRLAVFKELGVDLRLEVRSFPADYIPTTLEKIHIEQAFLIQLAQQRSQSPQP